MILDFLMTIVILHFHDYMIFSPKNKKTVIKACVFGQFSITLDPVYMEFYMAMCFTVRKSEENIEEFEEKIWFISSVNLNVF